MAERLTGLDSILALDVLRKLAEEGVRVVLTYDKGRHVYRIDLEGGLGDRKAQGIHRTPDGLPVWRAEGATFGDAVETALAIFRRAWAGEVPSS